MSRYARQRQNEVGYSILRKKIAREYPFSPNWDRITRIKHSTNLPVKQRAIQQRQHHGQS